MTRAHTTSGRRFPRPRPHTTRGRRSSLLPALPRVTRITGVTQSPAAACVEHEAAAGDPSAETRYYPTDRKNVETYLYAYPRQRTSPAGALPSYTRTPPARNRADSRDDSALVTSTVLLYVVVRYNNIVDVAVARRPHRVAPPPRSGCPTNPSCAIAHITITTFAGHARSPSRRHAGTPRGRTGRLLAEHIVRYCTRVFMYNNMCIQFNDIFIYMYAL